MSKDLNAQELLQSIQDLYDELKRKQESGELNNNIELYYFYDEPDDVRDVIHEKGSCNE